MADGIPGWVVTSMIRSITEVSTKIKTILATWPLSLDSPSSSIAPLPSQLPEAPRGEHRPSPSQDRVRPDSGAGAGYRASATGSGTRPGMKIEPCPCGCNSPDPGTWRPAAPQSRGSAVMNLPPLSAYAGDAFDLTIDEVYALRTWRLAADGGLHPVSWGVEPWTPGVNEAKCYAHLQRVPLLSVIDPKGLGRHAETVSTVMLMSRQHVAELPTTAVGWREVSATDLVALRTEVIETPGIRVSWSDGSVEEYPMDRAPVMSQVPKHPTPHEWCTCGFYAYNTLDRAVSSARPVLGAVRLTGRILVGTKGFRAQKAEIVGLVKPDTFVEDYMTGAAELLAAAYPGVPILGTGEELVAEFPPSTFD